MSDYKYRLPVFNLKEKPYEAYRFELDCWLEVTSCPKKRQGTEVLLSLPESSCDEFKTREYLISKLTKEDITADDGITKILQHMDSHLKRDDLGLLWEKYVSFDSVERGNKSITEYISDFDVKYSELTKQGDVKLPQSILALMLIRKASLSPDVVKLALTGLDYTNKATLYDQAIASLRKFAGDHSSINSSSHSQGISASASGLFSPVKTEVCEVSEAEVFRAQSGFSPRYYGRGGGYRGRGGNTGSARGRRENGGAQAFKQTPVQAGGGGGKYNPKNKYGDFLRCHCCGSFRHLLADCPENGNGASTSTVVLYTGNVASYMTELSIEADLCAVLDSACSKTVCGSAWMERYLSCLPNNMRDKIKVETSNQEFRFGGGEQLLSQGLYTIPAKMAGEEVLIKTDVVDSHIPLLLSLSAMKKAGIILNTVKDSATIFGTEVNLGLTSSGHYCISLLDSEVINIPPEVLHVDLSEGEIHKQLLHLHRQFAHPSNAKLTELLKNANSWKSSYTSILDNITKKCDTCLKYRKSPNKPIVSLPLATRFNQVLTMDLKKWDNFWIVYFIDSYSRLVVARKIQRKFPYEVVQAFMNGWLSAGYGIPEEIFHDLGGEFTAEEMQEMTSVLNIKVNTTAAHSPFSNGLCERNHAVMDAMITKLQADNPKMAIEDLISWACAVKNSMCMFAGFSPYQIVFGRNPVLPGFGDVHPPATNDVKSETLYNHLRALNSARLAFVEAETSEKIRRALRHKIRVTERHYEPGNSVYYKKENSVQWLGPAKVLFQDGKVVFLRHGGSIIRVYVNRIVLRGEEYGHNTNDETSELQQASSERQCTTHMQDGNIDSDREISENDHDDEPSNLQHTGDSSDILSRTGHDSAPSPSQACDQLGNAVSWKEIKVNDTIMFRKNDSDTWTAGTVVSRGGKASGKYATWYNVDTGEDSMSVDLSAMDVIRIPQTSSGVTTSSGDSGVTTSGEQNLEECDANNITSVNKSETVYLAKHKCAKTVQAQLDEIQKLQDFDTYDVVEDVGQERISTRWLITTKDSGDIKARLVARGFEEECDQQTDSPTVSKSVIRVFMAICVTLGWLIKTTDIKSAFLQGQDMDRDVYIQPPRGFECSTKLWKLKKCLYGLNDAARKFYLCVKSCLVNLGCKMSNLEPAIFVYTVADKIEGIILCHVDDFLHGGSAVFERNIIARLIEKFKASKQECGDFKYIGLDILQEKECIKVSQDSYLANVELQKPPWNRSSGSELSSEEYTQFRSCVGKINWVVSGTRPDCGFSMINLSTKFQNAHVAHLTESIKVMKRLKSDKCVLKFPKLNTLADCEIVVFTDASLANLNGVDSCGGHIMFLVDSKKNCCPLAWHSGKLKRVARSTLAAEAMALLNGIEEAIYLREIIKFCTGDYIMIRAVVDNRSLLQSVHSTHLVEEKRLRVDISAVKEMMDNDNVTIVWVPGKEQLANCLTKNGAASAAMLTVLQHGSLTYINY